MKILSIGTVEFSARPLFELMDEARADGTRLKSACEVLGISTRIYQR